MSVTRFVIPPRSRRSLPTCVRLLRRRCTACRCRDLEGRAFPVVLGLGPEERSDEAFDLPCVELGRWCVGEIKLGWVGKP